MNKLKYIINNKHSVKIDNKVIITNSQILQAIEFSNEALISLDKQTKEFEINIFEIIYT